jgi:hypothetical protein
MWAVEYLNLRIWIQNDAMTDQHERIRHPAPCTGTNVLILIPLLNLLTFSSFLLML